MTGIPQPAHRELILGSGSSIRADLLRRAGVAHRQVSARIDEAALRAQEESPEQAALDLARAKAAEVAHRTGESLIVASDQVLWFGGRLWGKPAGREDLRHRLEAMAGQTHELIGGTVLYVEGREHWSWLSRVRLTMIARNDAVIAWYLDHAPQEIYATVGGYQLEGIGIQLFSRLDGDWFSALGLPLIALIAELHAIGYLPDHGT